MEIFFTILETLIPLYLVIGLGWLAGKTFNIDIKSISALIIYFFAPFTVFGFIYNIDFQKEYFALPLFTLFFASIVGITFWQIGKKLYPDDRANLLGVATAQGNTGFFGIPVALALFSHEQVGIYVLFDVGGALFMATTLYFIAAKGQFSTRESLNKIARFPILYGTLAGITCNLLDIPMPNGFETYHAYFVGALIILGMMIIGLSLSDIQKITIPWRFLTITLIGRLIVWPLLALAFIAFDKNVLHIYDNDIHKMMFIIATVPVGAYVAALSAQFDMRRDKAAIVIIISTALALFTIPAWFAISGLF